MGVSGSRSFNGSSDFISQTPPLNGVVQLSISFWLNWTTFANTDNLAMEYSPNYGINPGSFIIDPNSGNPNGIFYIGISSTNGNNTQGAITRPSAGAWHHYLFILDLTQNGNAAIPTIYLDGTSQSISYTHSGGGWAGGTTLGNYTLYYMSRAGSSLFGNGSMADVGMWNTLLSQGEATALSVGALPHQIRTASLIDFLPFNGLASPEPDLSGKANSGTLTGTTAASGPPVMQFTPRWPQQVIASAATFNPAWARGRNQFIEGFAS